MEACLKYCLSFLVGILILSGCDMISNETYHKLSINERRKLSADYTQLAMRLEMGSPKNMRLLEKAIRINPKNDLAYHELSIPYLYRGMLKEWAEYSNTAIKLNPQAWQGWRGYYKLFYFRDYGGALFDLDATDTLTVDQTDYASNMSVDYMRGLCYLGLKNFDKAEEYFNIYIEKETAENGAAYVDENAFLYLGIIKNYRKDYMAAVQQFERALLYETGIADVHYHKARALYAMGQNQEAEIDLEKAKTLMQEQKYLRGYFYEALEQIYESDIKRLEAHIKSTP
jgi:tetratricopeptide (TPR) repeat protein